MSAPLTLEQRAQMREDAADILERDAAALPKEQAAEGRRWRDIATENRMRAAELRAYAAAVAPESGA